MVTETMTVKEIIANVADDIDVLNRRATNYFSKHYRKEVLRRGKYPFVFRYETKTKGGNHYILIGCVASRKMALRGLVLIMSFLELDTCGGKVLIRVAGMGGDDLFLTFFTPHFWSRYRERMKMGDMSFPALVQRFFERNCSEGFPISKLRNDNIEYEVAINDGSVMVQMVDGKFTAKTFISKSTFGWEKRFRHEVSAIDMMQMEDLDEFTRELCRTAPKPKIGDTYKIPQLNKVS